MARVRPSVQSVYQAVPSHRISTSPRLPSPPSPLAERTVMSKTILITGAGSGFGEAAAIGIAKNGHHVIATVQVSPHVLPLREKAKALGLSHLRVEKLDLCDPYDVAYA